MFELIIKAKTANELRDSVKDLNTVFDINILEKSEESTDVASVDFGIPVATEIEEFVVENNTPGIDSSVTDTSNMRLHDSRGVPYDARIHSANRSLNKDGSWRIRRGLNEDQVKKIEDELKNASKASSNNIPPPPAPTVNVEFPFDPAAASPQVLPEAKPEQKYENFPNPAMLSARPIHSLSSFKGNLPMILAQLISDKKIDQAYIEKLKEYFKVSEIWHIVNDDAKLTDLFRTFEAIGLITKVEE